MHSPWADKIQALNLFLFHQLQTVFRLKCVPNSSFKSLTIAGRLITNHFIAEEMVDKHMNLQDLKKNPDKFTYREVFEIAN